MNSIVVVFLVVVSVISAEITVAENNRHDNENTGKGASVLDKSQLLNIRSVMAKLKTETAKGNEDEGISILENLIRSLNVSAIQRSNVEDINENNPMKNDLKYSPNTEIKDNYGFGATIDTKGRSGFVHRGQHLHLPLLSKNRLFRNVGHPHTIFPSIFNKMHHHHNPVYMLGSITETRRTGVEEDIAEDITQNKSDILSEDYLEDANSYKIFSEKK